MSNLFQRWVVLVSLLVAWPATGEIRSPSAADRAAVPVLDGKPRQIIPGVYSLGELAPVFAYLIEAGDGLVLVDTGYNSQLDRLAQAIVELGFDPNDISHIVVTHLHLDHWMNMGWISGMTGATTYMGRADAEVVELGAPPELVIPARIVPANLSVPPTDIDYLIEAEVRLPIPGIDLRAIPCGGHTPGSVCYLMQSGDWRILFGGDTVMSVRSGLGTYMARLHPRLGGQIDAYRKTLARLAEIQVNLVLPGHPYFDRERTGNHPHPVVSPENWIAVLEEGARELDEIERRFEQDGRDFLDETPKRLAGDLFYLGLGGGGASYALTRSGRTCLIDPSALGPEQLMASLRGLGLDPFNVEAALLTRSPYRTDTLRQLAAGGVLKVYGRRSALVGLKGLSTLATRPVDGGRAISACQIDLEALVTDGWRSDSLTYLARFDGDLAAFTGEAVSSLTADRTLVPHAGPPSGERDSFFDPLAALERLKVALWLPSRPFAYQNANLYGDEWRRTVRVNRLALASRRSSSR